MTWDQAMRLATVRASLFGRRQRVRKNRDGSGTWRAVSLR